MPVRHIIRSSALLLVLAVPRRSVAQSATTLLPDATVLPRGAIRLRGLTAFTRYDELFGTGSPSLHNLASGFATDSLGARQVPSLSAAENAVRSLSGISNFRLTAGQLVSAANSRVVTAPLAIDYGLTSRLSFGVVVPLVETRTTLYTQLNPHTGLANVGPNPALTSATARSANAALIQSLTAAATALQTRLQQCQAGPTTAGCPALLTQQAAATALIQSSGAFGASLAELYGTDPASNPGRVFVPLVADPAQIAINAKIADFKQQYKDLLTSDLVSGGVTAAGGPAARAQMGALLAGLGFDSLGSTDRASIGDISVGATLQLFNSFGDTTRGPFRYRVAINGTYRIGTGEPAARNRLFDVATGYGQPGVEAGLATDIQLTGRLMVSAIGSYTAQIGTRDVARIPNAANEPFPLGAGVGGTYSAGNVTAITIIPRWRIAGYFGLNGFYSLVRTEADTYTPLGEATADGPVAPFGLTASTAQQVGVGFSYSTVVSPDRAPGRIPFEVSFSHLEMLAANGNAVPKTFRDQIELRVYLRR